MNILDRLEHEPSYCLQSDERQLRRDAAAEIRRLLQELREAKAQAEQAA